MDLGRVGVWTFQLDLQPMARAREVVAELDELGRIWTDCMLRLTPSAVSKLQRIAQTQDRMLARMYQRPAAGGLQLGL